MVPSPEGLLHADRATRTLRPALQRTVRIVDARRARGCITARRPVSVGRLSGLPAAVAHFGELLDLPLMDARQPIAVGARWIESRISRINAIAHGLDVRAILVDAPAQLIGSAPP